MVKPTTLGRLARIRSWHSCKKSFRTRREREYRRHVSRLQARNNCRKEEQEGQNFLFVQSLSRLQVCVVGQAHQNALPKMRGTAHAKEQRREMCERGLCERRITRKSLRATMRSPFVIRSSQTRPKFWQYAARRYRNLRAADFHSANACVSRRIRRRG